MDEVKFSLRKSDFDKFAERLGVNPEELLSALRAEVVKVGSGFRYVIDMENFFYFVVSRIVTVAQKREGASRQIALEEFERTLNEVIEKLAGISGYAKLVEVRDAVMEQLGIREEDFARLLSELLQARRGAYVLLEGGDLKVQIGAKKYGFIKRVERRAVAEVTYY
ncbi:MAG: hypothetical protein ACPL3C_10045 [Pyrobaculum sp.]